ncbi:MAG: CoA-binding protein [Pseudomonadota bacterium]|nr:CoA-binding protein [Pseudomonadota bacterium]
MTVKRNLKRFFAPRKVAVVGASTTKGRPGHTAIQNMRANGYRGVIYPVNPRGGRMFGLEVFKTIDDLPPGIDLAIVILPAAATPQAVRDCAERKIGCVVLVAGGFAEVDHAGEDLQEELSRVARETGVRVLGPNTAGHISTPAKFTSSFFPLGTIPKGPISYVAQTGNFTGAMMKHIMSAENYGVARCIGLGNTVDIDETDVFEFLADDPHTKAVFFYLESLRRPREFVKIAKRVTKTKPVILLKGGATPDGAIAALSHTASMGSDDSILSGAMRQAGVVRIDEFSQLFLAAKAVAPMPVPAGNRVGFVSPSGAFIVHISDLCRQRLDLTFPPLAGKTMNRLKEISPPFIRLSNPVDIFPSATVHGMEYAYREAMEAVLADSSVDAVVSIMILTRELGIPSLDFIPKLAKKHPKKPIYISFSGDHECNNEAKEFLEPRGIPTFPLIEDSFKALDVLVRARKALRK